MERENLKREIADAIRWAYLRRGTNPEGVADAILARLDALGLKIVEVRREERQPFNYRED